MKKILLGTTLILGLLLTGCGSQYPQPTYNSYAPIDYSAQHDYSGFTNKNKPNRYRVRETSPNRYSVRQINRSTTWNPVY